MAVSVMSVIGILVAIFVCALTSFSIYIILLRRKYRHIPGPPLDNFFFGMVPTFKRQFSKGKIFADLSLEWCKKYGKLYKIQPMHQVIIFTADPEAVRDLMITGNHHKPKKQYDQLFHLFGERFMGIGLAAETDQKIWVWRRALMNPCFQRSYVRGFETALNSEVDLLMTRLTGLADGKTKVYMLDELNHLTLDIIGKIGFGMQMNNVENRTEKSEFTKAITLIFAGLSQALRDPFYRLRISKWKFIGDVQRATRYVRVFSRQCFKDRMAALQSEAYTPDDILNHLVKMKLENPELDEEVILDDITTFFVAGQETTANLLSFAMVSLWQNKEVFERLRTEIHDVVGVKPYISIDDANKLTYLEMVLKETLRLYPPAPQTFREASHDIEILGHKVPAGTIIALSTYVSSRLEEFFPDPLKFDPERFNLKAESKIPSYTYYPFTLGPRTCIGKNFAEIEAKIILAKIMQRFNFEMEPDQSFDIEESTTLKPRGGVVCTFTPCDSFEL